MARVPIPHRRDVRSILPTLSSVGGGRVVALSLPLGGLSECGEGRVGSVRRAGDAWDRWPEVSRGGGKEGWG